MRNDAHFLSDAFRTAPPRGGHFELSSKFSSAQNRGFDFSGLGMGLEDLEIKISRRFLLPSKIYVGRDKKRSENPIWRIGGGNTQFAIAIPGCTVS